MKSVSSIFFLFFEEIFGSTLGENFSSLFRIDFQIESEFLDLELICIPRSVPLCLDLNRRLFSWICSGTQSFKSGMELVCCDFSSICGYFKVELCLFDFNRTKPKIHLGVAVGNPSEYHKF